MQEKNVENFVSELVERYPKLIVVRKEIEESYEVLKNAYRNGGKLLIAGNGGSCADSEHIVGELMKDRKSTRLNSSHPNPSRMPSSA